MKRKRIGVVVAMLIATVVIGGISAYAAGASGTIYSSDIGASMYGFIEYKEGKFFKEDRIGYIASIFGSGVNMVSNAYGSNAKAYVIPGTDDDLLYKANAGRVYLDSTMRYISVKGEKCGYGGKKGVLKMHLAGLTSTIIAK